MISSRVSITAGKVVKSNPIHRASTSITSSKSAGQDITANILETPMMGSGSPSTMLNGGLAFNTTFMGILPDYNEQLMLQFYRDMYYYDSVAGACVDIISHFPFSNWTLTGVKNEDMSVFTDSLARLNIRSMLTEISMTHLVDGQFTGSLVYDKSTKTFQDMLMHDAAQTQVTSQPFYSMDPAITVNTADKLNQLFSSGSPYLQSMMSNYPKGLIDTFRRGPVTLDPLTTIYLPRRALHDRTHASYLKRLLPVYLLEKILYRGTLVEAGKRLRSTTHIQIGDDTWEPTPNEMQAILGDFQRTELDPLGAWIATRQGVTVSDIRAGGDFWKWSDNIDTFTPYKLRALGISEAFLSADANYSTAEAAVSVFMDNMDAYRETTTYKIFTSKIFPLLAVLNGLYKDPREAREIKNSGDFMFNVSNQKNLQIPDIRWHKSLEGKDQSSEFESLEKLSEKGFTIPLKMWAAAAGVDVTSLVHDLKEDEEIRRKMAAITKQPVGEGDSEADEGYDESGNEGMDMRSSGLDSGTSPMSSPFARRSRPLLSREFGAEASTLSKTGKKKAIYNQSAATTRTNEMIVKASKALQDPEHRERVRRAVQSKLKNTDMKL